jgi:ubiquinone biosynthesis protein
MAKNTEKMEEVKEELKQEAKTETTEQAAAEKAVEKTAKKTASKPAKEKKPEQAEVPADEVKAEAAEAAADEYAAQIADLAAEKAAEKVAEMMAAKMEERLKEAEQPKTLSQKVQKRREERTETREKRREEKTEAREKSKAARHLELQERKDRLQHSKEELSDKLKSLLKHELKEKDQKEKHRAAEILGVFSAHNFYANGFTPEEMRTTLEDLGPTYVKIGQIMSSRVDLLPESYCKELEKLRQNVKELDPQIARAVIEQESGKKIEELFDEFRDEPLGSASIGQAHYAKMKDGTKVVVKVQRPLIADMMRNDYVLLKKGAAMVNAINDASDDDSEKIDLLSVIEEMEKVTEEELDFRIEAENTRFFKENCIEDETKISCPTVIDELTTERMFTMTFVDGCSIGKKDKVIAQGCDVNEIGSVIVDNYLHQVLDVGTFHADPHQGNIMVAGGIPYWIDFGMIGRITEADVGILQNLILSLLDGDMDALVNAVMSMGAASPRTNRNKLLEDVEVIFGKYMNVTSINDIDLGALLEEVIDICTKHYITLPGKYTMLVRSIATFEGVLEQLCPDLNLFELVSGKLMDRAKKSMDVSKELLSAGKDALEISKKTVRLPVLASDALNSMIKGRMKINMELTGYEEIVDKAEKTVLNIVLAVFACVLFFGSCILTTANINPKTSNGVPLIAVIGIIFSIALAIFTIRRMLKKK